MKKNLSLAICLLIFPIATFSQTKLIAHKSHSGSLSDFEVTQSSDNFGLPQQILKSITWLSDTSVLEKGEHWGREYVDTVYNHIYCNNPNISIDSLKKLYSDHVEFINFDKRKNNGFFPFNPGNNFPKGPSGILILIVSIALLSFMMAIKTWKSQTIKQKISF